MSRKIRLDDDIDFGADFNPISAAAKLPEDISNGINPLSNFMEIPCDQIIEYQDKRSSDFQSYVGTVKFYLLVDSISKTGVMDPVIVRALPSGGYEMLSGEHRWKASLEAGKDTIKAQVLRDISDELAGEYFRIPNLLRRDNTVADLVNGWWAWLQDNRYRNIDADVLDAATQTQGENLEVLSRRQIQRYAKMHELIPEFLAQLDAPQNPLPIVVGYQLAFLTPAQQEEVFSLKAKINEKQASEIHKLSESGNWSLAKIKEILEGKIRKQNDYSLTPVKNTIYKFVKKKIKKEYYAQLPTLMEEAMALVLEQHPELKTDD